MRVVSGSPTGRVVKCVSQGYEKKGHLFNETSLIMQTFAL